jgi:hypothetical protein
VDWTGIVGGIIGGVIGVTGGAFATVLGNRGALERSREERLDARHERAYIEVLFAAHAIDRLTRAWLSSAKDAPAAQAFMDGTPNELLQRARVYSKFGSADVQRLYDEVTDRVLNVTAKFTSASTDDYATIFEAVTALDDQISREMAQPEKKD